MGVRSESVAGFVAAVAGLYVVSRPVLAHVGGLGGASVGGTIPTWLTIATGGVIVGATFLFTSLLTDHEAIRAINAWGVSVSLSDDVRRTLGRLLGAAGVGVLFLVVASGLVGPRRATDNFAILVVWAGWWAGYTMTVYLVGNTWPALNPWRAIARVLPRPRRLEYPERLGGWPSVLGLLAMVGIEVVSPVASNPVLLAVFVLLYTSLTLAGASLFGIDTWFGRVDPIARVFRCYGRVAPFQRTESGIEFKLPTAALAGRSENRGERAPFVIALLWVTTFDGLVSTPTWDRIARFLLGTTPPRTLIYLLYFLALFAGYGLFLWLYRVATRRAKESANTYVAADYLERYFAPSLLPIAAGYHVAHFLGYLLSLSPVLLAVLAHPLTAPPTDRVIVVPDWFGLLKLGFILGGHVLAVWVAHARSFELFPGAFKPIRSQYSITAAMIVYTMISMWVVVQPFTAPPYV